MSTLVTLSTFYYGTTSTTSNNKIDFSEGGPALVATIPIGDYSVSEWIDAWETALNIAGALTYTVTFNRTTRKMTISATGTFSLLSNTGTHGGTSAFPLGGWSTLVDKTGSNTYTSDNGAGYEYRPQFILHSYTAAEDFEVKENSVVNTSTSGVVQTLQFGEGQRIEMNIVGITNKTGLVQSLFYENPTGVEDARQFMRFLITKAKVEFMPNVAARGTFTKVILESTKAGRDGTAFKLYNWEGQKDFFETDELLFRKAIA